MSKSCHLIALGKLKEKGLQELELEYLKRLTQFKLNIHELKAQSEDPEKEAKEVLKKIAEISDQSKVILLAEQGKIFNTMDFSNWVKKEFESNQQLVFVLGGAMGHGLALTQKYNSKISLSPLTFPHQIARILLVEQLYRAQTLWINHPYHN